MSDPISLAALRSAAEEYADIVGGGRGPGAVATPEAVLAVIGVAEAIHALDDQWYPMLAGRAMGERTQGHIETAERWEQFCREWRSLVDGAPC